MGELREKLKSYAMDNHFKKYGELNAKNLEKIADEYVIGFAEWCIEWRVEFVDDTREGILYTYGGMYQKYTMNEILEIYKKEKGL